MNDLTRHLSAEELPPVKASLEHQLHETDAQIDEAVCDLYELDDAERALIDEADLAT